MVLLDIGVPGLDGYEAARQIRQHLNGKRPFLVALTEYTQPEDRDRSQEAGIDLHLAKPADPESILCLVKECSARPTI